MNTCRAAFRALLAAAFISARAGEPISIPQLCATDLTRQHPDWKVYEPDPEYTKEHPQLGDTLVPLVSDDFDSDGRADVALLAMFQWHPPKDQRLRKSVQVFACLSSRGNRLISVSHVASADSEYGLEVANSTPEKGGFNDPKRGNTKGIVW